MLLLHPLFYMNIMNSSFAILKFIFTFQNVESGRKVKAVIAALGGINSFKMFSGCGVYIYLIFHSGKTDALYSCSGSSSSSIEGGWCLSLWRGKWPHRERLSCRVLKPANDWLLMMPLGPPGEWVPAAMMSGKREDTPARGQRGFWVRKKPVVQMGEELRL